MTADSGDDQLIRQLAPATPDWCNSAFCCADTNVRDYNGLFWPCVRLSRRRAQVDHYEVCISLSA